MDGVKENIKSFDLHGQDAHLNKAEEN